MKFFEKKILNLKIFLNDFKTQEINLIFTNIFTNFIKINLEKNNLDKYFYF